MDSLVGTRVYSLKIDDEHKKSSQNQNVVLPHRQRKVAIMEGERELTTGLLSKGASFRLVVSGSVGVKEIDRLIRKLELDKEILAENNDGDEDNNGIM